MSDDALLVPDPRVKTVPAGWWESQVLPVVQACESWQQLDEYEGQLLAMANLIEGMGGDSLEFQKALRVVEYRRGQLLNPEVTQGQRVHLLMREKVEKSAAVRYRQLARYWQNTLYPYLLKQTDPRNVTQSRLLQLIHRIANKGKQDENRIAAGDFSQLYDVIVVDPPWPMEKIERDVRPNQSVFDYLTMTEEELAGFLLPMRADCHVWLWTTHRFLPMAFRLLAAWALQYVCTFVWHKPGGFQPVGLPQYNCEFALYARHGSPTFTSTRAFNVCFDAPRGTHSEKPDAFYAMVRRVTDGDRIDIFNRRTIEGFTGWGNQAPA